MSGCLKTRGTIFALAMLLGGVLVPCVAAQAPADAEALVQEQTAIESDASLNSRARRVIFRARANQDKGDFAKAVEVISQWLDGHPDRYHHLLFFTRASSYENLEKRELALKDLEAAVKQEPRFGRAWLKLGETAYQLELFSVAGDAFAKAYDLTPSAPAELLF